MSSLPTGGSAATLKGPAARRSITRLIASATSSAWTNGNGKRPSNRRNGRRPLQDETGPHPGDRNRRASEPLFVFVEKRFRCGLVAAVRRRCDSCRRPRFIHALAVASGSVGAHRGHVNQLADTAGVSSL